MENQNNYLQHHGVKGQKWGVRKEEERQAEYEHERRINDEQIRVQKKMYQLENKQNKLEQKEKRKKILRNIAIGVVLTAAGVGIVKALLGSRFSGQSANEAIKSNPNTISYGKQYTTGYSNVPVKNLSSSKRLGIKNYAGKNATYNISSNNYKKFKIKNGRITSFL